MTPPRILVVDDNPHPSVDPLIDALARSGAEPELVEPHELSRAHVDEADLILVDFRLDDWVALRDEADGGLSASEYLIASKPRDGLALAATIRSHLARDKTQAVAL